MKGGRGEGILDSPGAGAALSSLMQTYACLHKSPATAAAAAAAASDLMLIARDNLISNQNSKSQISETPNENCEMRVDKWPREEEEGGRRESGKSGCVCMKMQSSFAFDLCINEAIKPDTTAAATAAATS